MKYLLDTDVIIHYLKGANQKIVDQIHTALESGSEMHISVITLAEYYHGAYTHRAIPNMKFLSCEILSPLRKWRL